MMKIGKIEAYNKVEKYEEFQSLRPDYMKAILASLKLAKKYTENKDSITISDFCCGAGSNTKKYAELMNITKAILIDINKGFLNLAKSSQIKAEQIEIINKDVLEVSFRKESDIVFSIFAYHHMPNDKKQIFINKIKDSLKDGGVLILTEIYLPTKELCLKYYEKLLNEIPDDVKIEGLEDFLKQTANSTDFEFKVSKSFTNKLLIDNGFRKIDELKIWPKDNSFDQDIGTFVEVFKL